MEPEKTVAKHTPGPWRVVGEDRVTAEIVADIPWGDSQPTTHVVCFGHDYDDHGGFGSRVHENPSHKFNWDEEAYNAECMANARLIAAAPELLALLLESQDDIGGDWRQRRDSLLARVIGLAGIEVRTESVKEVSSVTYGGVPMEIVGGDTGD